MCSYIRSVPVSDKEHHGVTDLVSDHTSYSRIYNKFPLFPSPDCQLRHERQHYTRNLQVPVTRQSEGWGGGGFFSYILVLRLDFNIGCYYLYKLRKCKTTCLCLPILNFRPRLNLFRPTDKIPTTVSPCIPDSPDRS